MISKRKPITDSPMQLEESPSVHVGSASTPQHPAHSQSQKGAGAVVHACHPMLENSRLQSEFRNTWGCTGRYQVTKVQLSQDKTGITLTCGAILLAHKSRQNETRIKCAMALSIWLTLSNGAKQTTEL